MLIITNQSVINRGIVTREALDSLHRKMIRDIARAGGEISGIYYCPHRPDEGCDCRKPGTALLKQAARDHRLNLKKCVFVGDTLKDLEAGKGVGCRTILVQTGQGRETLKKIFQRDNPGGSFWIARDLFRCTDLIIRLIHLQSLWHRRTLRENKIVWRDYCETKAGGKVRGGKSKSARGRFPGHF